jgi:hypothetical protein
MLNNCQKFSRGFVTRVVLDAWEEAGAGRSSGEVRERSKLSAGTRLGKPALGARRRACRRQGA